MDVAEVICDICGRAQAAAADGGIRLNYCPSCQRFACTTCWIPTAETCRQCLLGGPDFATGRLTPRVADTFEASTLVSPQRRQSASQTGPRQWSDAAAPDQASEIVKANPRWGCAAALITVLFIAGVFVSNALTASEELPGGGAATVAPAVLPAATQSPSVLSSRMSPGATYTVMAGDTLMSIAAQLYGDESLWQRIHQANRAAVPDPDDLRVGQSLVIPPR